MKMIKRMMNEETGITLTQNVCTLWFPDDETNHVIIEYPLHQENLDFEYIEEDVEVYKVLIDKINERINYLSKGDYEDD